MISREKSCRQYPLLSEYLDRVSKIEVESKENQADSQGYCISRH